MIFVYHTTIKQLDEVMLYESPDESYVQAMAVKYKHLIYFYADLTTENY